MRLEDKVAIITGASSGIGQATALALAGRKARLCLLARSEARLAQVIEQVKASGAPEAFGLGHLHVHLPDCA